MNQFNALQAILVFDIETVPIVAEYDQLTERQQKLWYHKVSKIVPEFENPETFFTARAGVMAEFAKVICIVVGAYFVDVSGKIGLQQKVIKAAEEQELLLQFTQIVQQFKSKHPNFKLGGHNIKEFDIPFLCRRMLIHQLSLPEWMPHPGAKPWEFECEDSLQYWKFGDYKHYTSLDLLAEVLGIPSPKTDLDGSKVQSVYYQDNDLERIVHYCRQDVSTSAKILARLKGFSLDQLSF